MDQRTPELQVATGNVGLQLNHVGQLCNRFIVAIFFEIDQRAMEFVGHLNLVFRINGRFLAAAVGRRCLKPDNRGLVAFPLA